MVHDRVPELLVLIVVGLFIKKFIDADDVEFDLGTALKSALGGCLSGAAGENLKNSFKSDFGRQLIFSYLAMVLQVLALMPLRTVMNYQYRYGTSSTHAIKMLYADGGWTRYYQGLAAALIRGPVSRFGDTAANAGVLALLQSNTFMKKLSTFVKTIFATIAAACFRMLLTLVDTIKTTMQARGKDGMALLRARVRKYGIGTLWHGTLATAAAAFVGHYPCFGTYNYNLDTALLLPTTVLEKLIRSAFIGFVVSLASDCISNSLHVVNATRGAYLDAARAVIAADGVTGFFGRGLKTRILANGLQGIMYSGNCLWIYGTKRRVDVHDVCHECRRIVK